MDYLILALTTYRISNLIADEDGPFRMFEWLRGKVGVKRDSQGENYGTNNFAVGLVCRWCNSIWIGVILTLLYMIFEQVAIWVCLPLALSTVALTVSEINKLLMRWNSG